MIKSAFKFGLIVFVGAALMGCSDDVKAPADTALDKSNDASSIQRIDFDSRDACIKASTADMITLKLTDGTSLSLQRGLVDFVHLSQSKSSVDKLATSFDEVSKLRFNLAWGYDDEGCAQTVPILLHHQNSQIDYAGEGKPGAFDTMFSPLLGTRKRGSVALLKAYNQYELINIDKGGYRFSQLTNPQDVDWNQISGVSRYTKEQHYRHTLIRVGPEAYFHDATGERTFWQLGGLILKTEEDKVIGMFEHSQPLWRGGADKLILHFLLSNSFNAVVELNTQLVEEASHKEPKVDLDTPLINSVRVTQDIPKVINALNDLVPIEGATNNG